MADSDSDTEAYFEAAFCAVDVRPDPLSVESLQRSLLVSLATVLPRAPRSAPVRASAQTRGHRRSVLLPFDEAQHSLSTVDERDGVCRTLWVSFCSLTESGQVLSMSPVSCTASPSEVNNASCYEFVGAARRAGISHALFLRDPLQAWYLRGLDAPSTDPFASTLAVVTRAIERLKPSRVVCIGSSLGGYAAVRCGLALGDLHDGTVESVDVLSFAPQVFIDPWERVALNLPLMSFERALDRLKVAATALQFSLHSLVRLAADHAAAQAAHAERAAAYGGEEALLRPRVHLALHVGAQAPSDVREARLFEMSVAALHAAYLHLSVGVHVHECSGHCVAADLRARGELDGIVSSLLKTEMSTV